VAQHRRQHDQAHGDDGRAHDALGGGEQYAHQHDRDRKPTGARAEQPAHGFQQVLGEARAFEHHAHEHKQRDRDQHLVGHDAEHTGRQRAQQRQIHHARPVTGEREAERDTAERQRHRIARHQQGTQHDHHRHGE
jgi:hypothetical protein